jgi:hypothetical protein
MENNRLSWCGLTPEVSTLDFVIEKLGRPDDIEVISNGRIYHFHKGAIQVTVLTDAEYIRKIFITAEEAALPQTRREFEEVYGRIEEKKVDKLDGVIYERPGVRLATDFHGDLPKIRWIELF